MRRIIERIVTVVTTTTWKISWEEDPLRSKPTVDPVSGELPDPEIFPDAAQFATGMLDTKEADLPETKHVFISPANGLPEDPNSSSNDIGAE